MTELDFPVTRVTIIGAQDLAPFLRFSPHRPLKPRLESGQLLFAQTPGGPFFLQSVDLLWSSKNHSFKAVISLAAILLIIKIVTSYCYPLTLREYPEQFVQVKGWTHSAPVSIHLQSAVMRIISISWRWHHNGKCHHSSNTWHLCTTLVVNHWSLTSATAHHYHIPIYTRTCNQKCVKFNA